MKVVTHTPEETRKFASEFAKSLPSNAVIGLIGDLGAGKTVFIQGMAEGLGIDPECYVTSPTFALIHEYRKDGAAPVLRSSSATEGGSGAPTLTHFDLYRLNSFDELIDIGFEDYTQGDGICALEWANRFEELKLTHRVEIEIVSEEERQIIIRPYTP